MKARFLILALLLGFSFFSFSQKEDNMFQKVDSLIEKSQPNAAQDELWKVLDKAKKNQDHPNVLRAYTYFVKVLYPLEWEERADLFLKLYNSIDGLNEPVKSMVHTKLTVDVASNYYDWFGYQQHVLFDSLDLRDTDVRYNFVMENMGVLESRLDDLAQYDYAPFEGIIVSNRDSLKMVRSVSDFVAYHLISLYQNHTVRSGGTLKSAKEDAKEWYGISPDFIQLKLGGDLTSSILKLYQQIEQNNATHPTYLSTAVYMRIRYLKDEYNNQKRVSDAWETQFKFFESSSARSKFALEIANELYIKGSEYHYKTNPESEPLIKEAHTLLTEELIQFPENSFAVELKGLKAKIEAPNIDITFPNNIGVNTKLPLLLTYKNKTTQYLRVFKIIEEDILKVRSLRDYFLKDKVELVRTVKFELDNKGLYQVRTGESFEEGLKEPGRYLFVFTEERNNLSKLAESETTWSNANIKSGNVFVSDVDIVITSTTSHYLITVMDQKTEKPIKGAEIELYEYNYNDETFKKIESGKSDKDGLFFTKGNRNRSLKVVVKHKGSYRVESVNRGFPVDEQKHTRSTLITDRAIYRPGQTVYFKGLVYKGKDNDFKIASNEKVKITLFDASSKEVYQEVLVTNKYGSVDGNIQLPKVTSLGHFSLRLDVLSSNNGTGTNFRVEEYKRPTFEIKLDKPTETAKLDEEVSFTGNANAFAGYPISGAQVTYSVYRKWHTFWRFFYPGTSGGDLIHEDTLQTDGEGKFDITFFAETDPNAEKNAYYYYEVKVKVTDISGETHEKTEVLYLNRIGLSLQVEGPNRWLNHEDKSIKVEVVNLAGEPQKNHSGTLKVYQKIEDKYFLSRFWEQAESSFIKEEEFRKLYPYMKWDSYQKKSDELKLLKTVQFNSGDELKLQSILDKEQGEFIFEFESVTEHGDTLRTTKTISSIDVKSKKMPTKEALWTFVSSNEVKVGKSVDFQIGSSFKNAQALFTVTRKNKIIHQEWVKLNERFSFCYTMEEEDRGLVHFNALVYHNGQFFSSEQTVNVPFDNKKLIVKTSTFRDKLQPGEKEQWSFTIQDEKGTIKNAELAAVLYDASLDQIAGHSWSLWPYYPRYGNIRWSGSFSMTMNSIIDANHYNYGRGVGDLSYRFENLLYTPSRIYRLHARGGAVMTESFQTVTRDDISYMPSRDSASDEAVNEKSVIDNAGDEAPIKEENVTPRTNFNETAFFYPTIYANSEDEYVLNFTLPESLTKWKLLMLAHNKNMQVGEFQKEVEAHKELMVTANKPRFVRRGDKITFSAKVVNMTDEDQKVVVKLELRNPITEEVLDWILDEGIGFRMTVPANSSKDVKWNLDIGNDDLMEYTLTANGKTFSDGERDLIPVLSNRVLVTETEHIIIRDKGKSNHSFDGFVNKDSETIENKVYTIDYTDNLAWNAVLALPYLNMKNDQSLIGVVNSYYANAISRHIVEQHPRIETIFNQWKNYSPDALMSELEKNESLKTILLEETPWVMNAQNETEQRRRIAVLFELNQLKDNQQNMMNLLVQSQRGDGGFSWYKEGISSVYITQQVLLRLGQLKRMGIDISSFTNMTQRANKFLADKQLESYRKWKRDDNNFVIPGMDLHWLYVRSVMGETATGELQELIEYYQANLKKNWTKLNPYEQALAGIYFKREEFNKEANLVYASLMDRAKKNTHLGMYWVENSGYFWNQNSISSQSMIAQFFQEMNASASIMEEVRLWLILNKETSDWGTSIQTADAIAGILLTSGDYLKASPAPKIIVGGKELVYTTKTNNQQIEVDYTEGLGQVKNTWSGEEIKSDLGNISIEKSSEGPAALNLYWQYMEDLSAVQSSSNSSMSIKKKYYRIVPGAKKENLEETNSFTVGDKIQIEIIVTVVRDLDYVHIKDLRPAGFEPTSTVSSYRWGDISYYESPKDVSMDFFVERMQRGTYKMTYTVYATHSGEFNSGLATIQCQYAPAFSANSGTVDISIK